MTRYHSVGKTRPPVLFSLSLVTLLVACGDGSGPLDEVQSTANAVQGAAPTEIRPSISAAQLLNDNSLSVTDAQNAQAGNAPLAAAPAAAPVAAAPAVAEPVAEQANTAPAPATTAVEQSPPSLGAALPEEEESSVQQPSVVQSAEPVVVSEPEPAIAAATPSAAAGLVDSASAEPEQAAALPEAEVQTRFTGSNTPTFVGELMSDETVQLTWDVDPTARGYNVYRDAEYITTVFEESYNDDFEPFDRDYYYEIQAFTPDEIYTTVATGLTVKVTGTGRIDPNAPEVDEDLLDNYELVFSDEFNGTAIDTTKWNTAYLWGDDLIINNELQHYVDVANEPDFGFNPFSFDGESLTISTVPTPNELLDKANGQEFLSGVITSYDAFKFTYGYVEARAQVPVGKGYWPAFWLLNAYYDQDRPEIDIMEFIGDNQDTAYHTFHYYDEAGELRSTKSEPTFPIDFSADFHTFGAEWAPGRVTFYVDRIARHTIVDPKISQEEMYIIANTAIGGWWPGDPDETTQFPGEYKIDYIRAYQRVGIQEDAPQFANPDSAVPVRGPGTFSSPSHIPPFELWPDGFPAR